MHLKLWHDLLQLLEGSLSREAIALWLLPVKPLLASREKLVLEVPNGLHERIVIEGLFATAVGRLALGVHDAPAALPVDPRLHGIEGAVLDLDRHAPQALGDASNLEVYVQQLKELGYTAEGRVGQGHAPVAIAKLVSETGCDLLVMGAHGHRGLKDIVLGTTLDSVRHKVKVPVFIVQ